MEFKGKRGLYVGQTVNGLPCGYGKWDNGETTFYGDWKDSYFEQGIEIIHDIGVRNFHPNCAQYKYSTM